MVLVEHDKYEDIRIYASVYLAEIDEVQLVGKITEEMDVFILDSSTKK